MDYPLFFREKLVIGQQWLRQEKAHLQKRDLRFRHWLVLFLLAFGVGTGVKLVAARSLTIGYEDYKVAASRPSVDLNHLPLIPLADQAERRGPQCEE